MSRDQKRKNTLAHWSPLRKGKKELKNIHTYKQKKCAGIIFESAEPSKRLAAAITFSLCVKFQKRNEQKQKYRSGIRRTADGKL